MKKVSKSYRLFLIAKMPILLFLFCTTYYQMSFAQCNIADFDFEVQHFGNAVQFKDLSEPNMDIVKWKWDFGDDSGLRVDERPKHANGTYNWGIEVESDPLHIYEIPEDYRELKICYNVTLEVEFGTGDILSETKEVCIPLTYIEGTFNVQFVSPSSCPVTVEQGENVEFEVAAVGGTPPYTYEWSFDTGFEEADAGPYFRSYIDDDMESVTVTDANGSTAILSCEVIVGTPGDPRLSFTPDCANVSQETPFIGHYDPFALQDLWGTTNFEHSWLFRDVDMPQWISGNSTVYTFLSDGNYSVTFKVCNADNPNQCLSYTDDVTVKPDRGTTDPNAFIRITSPPNTGQQVLLHPGETYELVAAVQHEGQFASGARYCYSYNWKVRNDCEIHPFDRPPECKVTLDYDSRIQTGISTSKATLTIPEFSTSECYTDCIMGCYNIEVEVDYFLCADVSTSRNLKDFADCRIEVVPHPVEITSVDVQQGCNPTFSMTAKDGFRLLEPSNLGGLCNEATYYSAYEWKAMAIGGDNEVIDGLFTQSDKKCTGINLDHEYFDRFGANENRKFLVEATVLDERRNKDTYVRLVSLSAPIHFTIPSEMDMCQDDTDRPLSLQPVLAGGEGTITVDCKEGNCDAFDWTDPYNPTVNLREFSVGQTVDATFQATDSANPNCSTEDFNLSIEVTDSLDFSMPTRQRVGECKGIPEENITAKSTASIGTNVVYGSGVYTYIWTSNSEEYGVSMLEDPYVARTNVSLPPDGSTIVYTLTIRDELTGCETSKDISVDELDDFSLTLEISPENNIECYESDHLFTANWTYNKIHVTNLKWEWTSNHPNFELQSGSDFDGSNNQAIKSGMEQLLLNDKITSLAGDYSLFFEAKYLECAIKKEVKFTVLPQWEYQGFERTVKFVPEFPYWIDTWASPDNEVVGGAVEPVSYTYYNADVPYPSVVGSGLPASFGDQFLSDEDRTQLLTVITDKKGCQEDFLTNKAVEAASNTYHKMEIIALGENNSDYFCDLNDCSNGGQACFDIIYQLDIDREDVAALRKMQIVHQYTYVNASSQAIASAPFVDYIYYDSYDNVNNQAIYKGNVCYRINGCGGAGVPFSKTKTNYIWITAFHNSDYDPSTAVEGEIYRPPASQFYSSGSGHTFFHVHGRPRCDLPANHPDANLLDHCKCKENFGSDCDDCDFEDLTYNSNTGNFNSLQSCGSDFSNRQLNTDVNPTAEQYGSEALTHQRSQVNAKDYESVALGAYTTGRVYDNETEGEVFVLKQDATNSTEWQQYFSSTGKGIANGIVADDQEQVVLTGLFSQSIDFGGTQLNSNAGTEDIFLTKLDIDGNVLWSKQAGGNGYDEALDIAIDDVGNTYLTGYITGAATFDNITTSTPANKRSLFLAKYDANGQAQWVRTGEASENVRESVLVSSAGGDIYLANNFVGELVLEGGTTFTGNGLEESAMLTKYQTNGDVAWGKIIGQGSNVNLTAIVMDNTGQVTVAGEFDGTSSFDSEQALTTLGGTDLFFARYDGNGFQTDLQQKGGFENDYLQALATDGAGQYVFAGAVEGDDGLLDCVEEDVDDCSFAINEGVFDATCTGNDGAIFLEVAGEESLTFEWSNNVTTADNPNLEPGDYTLIITNTEGCKDTFEYVIEGGAVEITPQLIEPTCGLENGSIYVFPSGGYPPYSYAWSNNSTAPSITNLGAGTYTVTVTDSEDCEVIETFTFDAPTPLAIEFTITNTECGQEQGAIQTTVTGGTEPYTYQWADVADNTPNRTGLNAGSYTLTVTDSESCEEVDQAEVENTTMPDIDDDMDDVTCKGSDGAIYLTIDGVSGTFASQEIVESNQEVLRGRNEEILASERVDMLPGFDAKTGSEFNAEIAPLDAYQITWSNGEVGRNVEGLRAGTYVATISDGNGCEVTKLFELPDIIFYTVQGEVTNADCNDATGSINLSVLGGVEPFIYNWSNGETTQDISDLLPGAYEVTVIDANSCIVSEKFSVYTNNNLEIDASITSSSCGQENGSIALTITGAQGTPDIQWASNGALLGQTTTIATELEAGFYSVTVSDEGGCQVTEGFEVSDEDGEPLIVIVDEIEQHCDRDGGIINITATEGFGPYTFQWYRTENPRSAKVEEEVSTEEDLNIRRHGFYRVEVTDSRGCTVSSKGYERLYKQLTIDPYCEGAGGSYDVRSRKQGGSSKVTYTWSKDGSVLEDVGNIGYLSQTGEGFYCITVTDNKTGCPPVSGVIDVPTDCSGSTANINHSEVIYYTYPESGRSVEIKTNGFKDAIDIFLTNNQSEFIGVKLTDAQNNILYTELIEVAEGENSISLQIDNLDLVEGLYQLLLVEENGEMRQFTLVKLE